jgi:hypothetical protein
MDRDSGHADQEKNGQRGTICIHLRVHLSGTEQNRELLEAEFWGRVITQLASYNIDPTSNRWFLE